MTRPLIKKILKLLLLPTLFVCSFAEAKRFRNAYISFELPPNWNCKLEGSEWVCQNDFAQKAKEAIVILTAKEVGPNDTLGSYKAYLETPRTIVTKTGAPTKSQVLHVKERLIQNQTWIDGMHLGSEVGPYYTRYLATIKDRIAILVTFSAHKQHYTKYSGDFIKAIESLGVVATKDMLSDKSHAMAGANRGRESIGPPIGQMISSIDNSQLPSEGSSRSPIKRYSTFFMLAAMCAVAGIGLYIYTGRSK